MANDEASEGAIDVNYGVPLDGDGNPVVPLNADKRPEPSDAYGEDPGQWVKVFTEDGEVRIGPDA